MISTQHVKSFREYSPLKEALNYQIDKMLWSTNLSQPLSSAITVKVQRRMHEMDAGARDEGPTWVISMYSNIPRLI